VTSQELPLSLIVFEISWAWWNLGQRVGDAGLLFSVQAQRALPGVRYRPWNVRIVQCRGWHLVAGSVVFIDDIRGEDPRFWARPAETYRGWREIVGHARVRRAVEIGNNLGLLLLQ
jgi:hypothetical protein